MTVGLWTDSYVLKIAVILFMRTNTLLYCCCTNFQALLQHSCSLNDFISYFLCENSAKCT